MASTIEEGAMTCPFCGWEATDGEYLMLLHMETLHPEGDSPFIVKGNGEPSASGAATETETPADLDQDRDLEYTDCPVDGCGEMLPRAEMDYHLELHADEACGDSSPDPEHEPEPASGPVPSLAGGSSFRTHRRDRDQDRGRDRDRDRGRGKDRDREREHRHSDRSHRKSPSSTPQSRAIAAWKNLLKMPGTSSSSHSKSHSSRRHHASEAVTEEEKQANAKRLGRAQLGKYAHEERMPDWLVAHLQKGGQVKSEGVVPVLAQLLSQCPTTKYAYLCHPCVQHVSKLKKEGGFCGYRNIQMLASYINGTRFKGYRHFDGKIPSIFQIQDFIERAWDHGIHSSGRLETGGIKGTRKYIGTPEALAMLRVLEIPCDAQGFKLPEAGKSEALLLEEIETYFQSGVEDPSQRIRLTHLPPIYFQHAGHSMTIIGLEKTKSGAKNLLVFDPMFKDPSHIIKLVGRLERNDGQKVVVSDAEAALKSYRRGNKYLKKYREFEILRLRPLPETGGFPAVFSSDN